MCRSSPCWAEDDPGSLKERLCGEGGLAREEILTLCLLLELAQESPNAHGRDPPRVPPRLICGDPTP